MNIIRQSETREPDFMLDTKQGYAHMDNITYQAFKREHVNIVSPSRLKNYRLHPLLGLTADAQPDEKTDAMRFGSLVHAYALSPELIGTAFVEESKEVELKKDGTPYADGRQSAAQKAAWAELEAKGVQINSPEEHETARTMAENALQALEDAFLTDYAWEPELTMWHKPEGTDTIICGTADIVNRHSHSMADIKTTSSTELSFYELKSAFYKYGYDIQAGIYSILYKANFGTELDDFTFVFVSKTAPHLARCFTLYRADLNVCEFNAREAIDNYIDAHMADGETDLSPVLPQLTLCLANPSEE